MKKKLRIGLLGTFLALICDFLLGWMVYTKTCDHYVGMIASCNDLSYLRLGLSALFGAIGIPMQYFGLEAIAGLVGKGTSSERNVSREKSQRYQKLIHLGAVSMAVLGGVVHILCVTLMLCIKIECNHGFQPQNAANLIESIPESVKKFAVWAILPISLIMMIPYLIAAAVMFWAIVRGYTQLPKWFCLLNPIVAKVVLNLLAATVPNTALSNGLGMANMPIGTMLPFAACLIFLKRKKMDQVESE